MKKTVKTRSKKKPQSKPIFTQANFNSGDGMMTAAWGPAIWHFLHVISFNYPIHPTKADKTHYANYIKSLQTILPCKYCRINLKKNLKQLPMTDKVMKNRETFSQYVYQLHELVNKMLKKPPSGITYEALRNKYEQFRSRCTAKTIKLTRASHKKPRSTRKRKESGCVDPLHGKKSKCVVQIIKVS